MDLTRRDLLGLAAASAVVVVGAPLTALAAPAPTPVPFPARDAYALDELPLQGSAGACSCGRPSRA